MFKTIRQRFRDMGTINALCIEAKKLANADGQEEPGAEHFVLSAFALPDGTARKAFLRIHADPDNFRAAIVRQYEEALKNIGVAIPADAIVASEAMSLSTGAPYKGFKGQPSAQTLMKTMIYEIKVKEDKEHPATPLLSAHVLLAAATAQYGVAARAFRAMGIDSASLADAAKAEIAIYRTAHL